MKVHAERGARTQSRRARFTSAWWSWACSSLALKALDNLASCGFNRIEKWTSLPTDDLKSAPPMGYKGSGPSRVAHENRQAKEDEQNLARGALTHFGRVPANASAAVGVAHANRHAEEDAQGRERGGLAFGGMGASAAVGVAIANRHAKEEAQGLKRGALSGGASKRGKKSPGAGRHGITQERIDAEKAAGKKFGFCKCGKEGPLGGQHNLMVAGKAKYCGRYKPK